MKLPSGLLQGSPKIEGNSKTSDQGAALTVTSGWPQGSHSSLQCLTYLGKFSNSFCFRGRR